MPSPIEDVFKKIFGVLPKKSGAAYEQLAAIAMHMLDEGTAQHDARVRGQFSKTLYQLDVRHQTAGGETIMGEAKDYSERGEKVGRGDLQKLGGALPDLKEVDSGAFFSATGYTKPAKKYAGAASDIAGGKQIKLYELAVSTEEDEKGFIKTIVINMHLVIPHPNRGEFRAAFTSAGEAILKDAFLKNGEQSKSVSYGLREFYDHGGAVNMSLGTLTSLGYGEVDDETKCACACFWLPNHQIRIGDMLVPIHGLEYKIPYSFEHREMRITDDSEHRFVVRDGSGTPLTILTDKKLRSFSFDPDGNVVKQT